MRQIYPRLIIFKIFIFLFSLILLQSILLIGNANAFIIFGTIEINHGDAYTKSLDVILTLYATSDMGPIEEMMIANDSSFYNASWESYQTEKSWALTPGEGEKEVFVKYRNASGESDPYSDTIILDQSPPTGGIIINSEATYTNTTSVSLSISASDNFSLSQMMISNDSSFPGASWETYATSKAWIVPSSDGVKTVYVKFIDNAQNVSEVFSDSIILDTQSPQGLVKINNGVKYANKEEVTLSLTVTDNLFSSSELEMKISNDALFSQSVWESFSSTRKWKVDPGTGSKIVYVKFKDRAGNESLISSDWIILDTYPPTGWVIINNGDKYTKERKVNLGLHSGDNLGGALKMKVSENPSLSGAVWEDYKEKRDFTVSSTDDGKWVYVKYKDEAGNESKTYSDMIILDTHPPECSVVINNNDPSTISLNVTLTISAHEPKCGTYNGSGLKYMMISNDYNTVTNWELFSPQKDWRLSEGAYGKRYVWVKFGDSVGNTNYKYIASDEIEYVRSPDKVIRMAGDTRYETAVEISKKGWTKSDYVILATGEAFPDALAAAPLAGKLDAPILLTKSDNLPDCTKDEIISLKPKHIIILGTGDVISSTVVSDIEKKCKVLDDKGNPLYEILNANIHRLGGETRYETAAQISSWLNHPSNKTAILVNGERYQEALAASPVAAYKGMPILLVRKDSIPDCVKQQLQNHGITRTVIVGGPDAVSSDVASLLDNKLDNNKYPAMRLFGDDEYATAKVVADWAVDTQKKYWPPIEMKSKEDNKLFNVFVATGEDFPDGLCLGPLAAKEGGPILLVRKPVSSWLRYTDKVEDYKNIREPVKGFASDKNNPLNFSDGGGGSTYEASAPTAEFVNAYYNDINYVYIAGGIDCVSDRVSSGFGLAADKTTPPVILIIQPHPDDMVHWVGWLAAKAGYRVIQVTATGGEASTLTSPYTGKEKPLRNFLSEWERITEDRNALNCLQDIYGWRSPEGFRINLQYRDTNLSKMTDAEKEKLPKLKEDPKILMSEWKDYFQNDLKAIYDFYKPTYIITTVNDFKNRDPQTEHPDHVAVSEAVASLFAGPDGNLNDKEAAEMAKVARFYRVYYDVISPYNKGKENTIFDDGDLTSDAQAVKISVIESYLDKSDNDRIPPKIKHPYGEATYLSAQQVWDCLYNFDNPDDRLKIKKEYFFKFKISEPPKQNQ